MKVLLTGANGFIGLPTIRELVARGHHVLALTGSDDGARKILSNDRLADNAITIDGVIHLAFNHDFASTDRVTVAKQDNAVLNALIDGLRRDRRAEKPLVVASGCAGLQPKSLLKAGCATLQPLAEDDDFERSGDRAFVPGVHAAIVENQRAVFLDEGTNRWPATHVDDAALALVLALEKGQRGYLHPIAEEGVAFKDIVKALGDLVGLPAESVGVEEFQTIYGWRAAFLTEDRPTTGREMQETHWLEASEAGSA